MQMNLWVRVDVFLNGSWRSSSKYLRMSNCNILKNFPVANLLANMKFLIQLGLFNKINCENRHPHRHAVVFLTKNMYFGQALNRHVVCRKGAPYVYTQFWSWLTSLSNLFPPNIALISASQMALRGLYMIPLFLFSPGTSHLLVEESLLKP